MAKFNPTIDPTFDAANFKKKNGTPYAINNNYLTYSPGTEYNYIVTDQNGEIIETRTVTVTNQTIQISGVTCTVVQDEVWDAEGNRIETALDYFAQDKNGNVWYFGEDVTNYNYDEAGTLIGTDSSGSWRADNKGASPGIVMLDSPQVGNSYEQEDAKGAHDYAIVTSTTESANLTQSDFGTLTGLLQTNDVNPLDTVGGQPVEQEYKYYSPDLHTEVYGTTAELDGKEYVSTETMQLVSITTDGTTQLVQAMASFGATESVSSSPLTATGPDEHASHHALVAPGHLT